ncbi:MAG: MlaD family protein [Gammaproteobacteria bacterium]|nr:MlaD family protein [Gammaproteobacteria bacterium]
MNPKVNYAMVGAFVLVFGAALIAWIFWLGVGVEKKVYNTYVAYMYQSVSGLNTKAAVKYRGVDVGKVQSIELDKENPERVKLLLDIEQGTPIKEDSIAILNTQGLTGLGYIELSGGSKEAPLLKAHAGKTYPEIITGPSLFVRMDTAISDMFVKFTTIVEEISGVSASVKQLLNKENQQSINQILGNVDHLTARLASQTDYLDTHLKLAENILRNGDKATEQLPATLNDLNKSLQGVQQIIADVSNTTSTLDQAVMGTQKEVSRSAASTLQQMSQLFDELRQTTFMLNRLIQEIERNPNMFIFGRKPEQAGPGER